MGQDPILFGPTWTWILLLFGIFPFLIAQYFATVHVEGIVPMSDVAQRRVAVFNRLFIGLVALGVVVIAVGFVLDTEAAVILVGLAILVASVFTMFSGDAFRATERCGHGRVGAVVLRSRALRRGARPFLQALRGASRRLEQQPHRQEVGAVRRGRADPRSAVRPLLRRTRNSVLTRD